MVCVNTSEEEGVPMSNIVMYFINWNDAFYLPFISRHYGRFCSKIVMYDNHSDDGSQRIGKQLGFEVRTFGMRGVLNDQHYLDVKNHCWKEQRGHADYVIVCDADEFLYLPEGMSLTSSAPQVKGYNIISDHLPKKEMGELCWGSPDDSYSKQVIFSPDRIREINFVHGCHRNNMVGDITSHDQLELRHMRMIGGFDRIWARHRTYARRMSQFNRQHRMGHHYLVSRDQKKFEWHTLISKSEKLW